MIANSNRNLNDGPSMSVTQQNYDIDIYLEKKK